jgi:hypothetical protein
MQAEMTSTAEPIFDSAHNALVFAFQYPSEQFAESFIAKLTSGHLGSGKGLVGVDGAAQAGLIQSAVRRALDDDQVAAVTARYTKKTEPCRCCGGDKMSKEFDEAVNRLAASLVPAGVSHMRVRRQLIAKHFGVRGIEFKALSEQYHCNRKTLSETYQEIRKRLDVIEQIAESEITWELKRARLIP